MEGEKLELSAEERIVNISAVWRQRGLIGKITLIVSFVMIVYHLLFVSGLLAHSGVYINIMAHAGASLAFMISIVLITKPAIEGRSRDKIPWYDIVLMLMGIAGAGYFFVFNESALLHLQLGETTSYEAVLFFSLVIASLEASRRVIGVTLSVIAILFLCHALFTDYFPAGLSGRSFSLNRLIAVFYLGDGGFFGSPMVIASTVIVAFIVFAEFLRLSGAASFFLDLAMALFGSARGGPAKISVFASALFATLSGTVTGNVAATGSVTIPLMKNTGYKPYFAGAVEAVSSKGGQITPPIMGAVAFLMANITGQLYATICLAAALPALLYFTSIFFQVDFEARKTGLEGLPRERLPSLKKTVKSGWYYVLPLFLLILLIGVIRYEPQMAAIYSLLFLWVITAFRKESRMGFAKIVVAFESAAKLICVAGIACALAGVIIGSLMGTGLGVTFSSSLVELSGHKLWLLLILTAIACYIMGMGMGSLSIYIVLSTLVGPALTAVGVPLLAAHLFIVYWGNISFITPPVCIAAFVAASIAGADPMKTGWQAVRLGIVSFIVPFMFVYDTTLIMMGEPMQIVLTVITSICGVILLASALENYLLIETKWIERIVLAAAGILLVYPGLFTDLLAIFIAGPVLLYQIKSAKKSMS